MALQASWPNRVFLSISPQPVSVGIRFVSLGLGLTSGVITMLVAESGVLGN